jgi:hypothetical protein
VFEAEVDQGIDFTKRNYSCSYGDSKSLAISRIEAIELTPSLNLSSHNEKPVQFIQCKPFQINFINGFTELRLRLVEDAYSFENRTLYQFKSETILIIL